MRALLQAVGSRWLWLMAGVLAILYTLVAFVVPASWLWPIYTGLAVGAVVLALALAWHHEHHEVLRLKLLNEPRIAFEHVPGAKPFDEERAEGSGKVRRLRVAIRNLGAAEIPIARVVLEACSDSSKAVHLESAFHPLDEPEGVQTIYLPPNGVRHVEIAREQTPSGAPGSVLELIYADKHLDGTFPGDRQSQVYTLTLRAEGAGLPARCRINLGRTLANRLESLTPLPGSSLSPAQPTTRRWRLPGLRGAHGTRWLRSLSPTFTMLSTLAALAAVVTSVCAVTQTRDSAREAREAQRPYCTLSLTATRSLERPEFAVDLRIENVGGRPANGIQGQVSAYAPDGSVSPINRVISVGNDIPQGVTLPWSSDSVAMPVSMPMLVAVSLRYSDPVLGVSYRQEWAFRWDGLRFQPATADERHLALLHLD